MSNNWNLERLERQAISNQNFDDYVLNESKILKHDNLKVLDIGCSNGFKTKMLFDKYENIIKIDGIDVDEKAIDEAKKDFLNNTKYRFELKSIDDLELNDKYDIINLSYVLQHLENPKEVLKKLRNMLTDRGVIIIKVPDDSFKFCYPNNDILKEIFDLYENEIMRKSSITRYTDRYIGKKVYNYLSESQYNDINLYYSITDTIGKTEEEKEKLFESSIAFRTGKDKENVSDEIKGKMELLLNKMKETFKQEGFYYTMSVLYYIARK